MKWCEIGPEKTLRHEVLSRYLTENSVTQEFHHVAANKENLKTQIEEAEKNFDVIRIHPSLWDVASQNIDQSFQELARIGSVDTLIKSRPKFWPENFYREAITQFLTGRTKKLDISLDALVIGACGMARSTTAGLIKLGFSKINVTSPDRADAKKLTDDFYKIFFNTQFQTTPKEELTLLPGVHGIVVNTLAFESAEDFLTDLYYYNFLKKGGLALDTSDIPVITPFIHIGKDIGAQIVMGYEVNAYFDKIWVKKVFNHDLDLEKYQARLKDELEKAPYDKERYQKVLTEFQI